MPRFVQCPGCGTDVDHGTRVPHRCATEQLGDQLESQLHGWLATAEGRRDTWWAVREVRRRP